MPWGDMGVTQLLQLQETAIPIPAVAGGSVTRTLQRAGLLRRLRFYYTGGLDISAQTTAAGKSVYGPLAGISKIAVTANGQTPLVNLSGYGAAIYNEIENRDGGVLARPLNISELNIADSLKLAQYDATSVASVFAKYPFEFQFSLPFSMRGQISELGLWLLQNQAIDVGIDVTFNPVYAAAATNNAVWSGGTGITATLNTGSQLEIERELYDIPNQAEDMPNLVWAHQIIEYTNTFTGSFSRFSLPRSGLLLRAIIINLDGSGNPVEYSDVKSLAWIYGANETPVIRKGLWYVEEFMNDYDRQPPKGVLSLDFYKWGWESTKLVKDTEVLANLRLETTFNATAAGTQLILLERLYPVLTAR